MERRSNMVGFDGDPAREAEVRAALAGLLDVFPEHLAKARPPTWFDAGELVRNDQFDAILRVHRKDRLALPVQALRASGARYHGFDGMRFRRLAWFVPTLLASWLERADGPEVEPFGASDLEAIFEATTSTEGDDGAWSDEESLALAAFFETALDAALVTPLAEAREPVIARPREDGVRIWSLHSPSVPLDLLRVARAFRLDLDPLIVRWALDPAPLALDHLLEAVFDTTLPAKHFLSHEAVADRLGESFFDASGERAARLSKAEATVRRNIERRDDRAFDVEW